MIESIINHQSNTNAYTPPPVSGHVLFVVDLREYAMDRRVSRWYASNVVWEEGDPFVESYGGVLNGSAYLYTLMNNSLGVRACLCARVCVCRKKGEKGGWWWWVVPLSSG